MTRRILAFLGFLLAGGGAGWWLAAWSGAAAGSCAGAILWFTLDTLRAARLMRWLRAGEFAPAPSGHGVWGEAAARVRRAIVLRDKETEAARARLDDFLEAIRGSPNGVILIDARGRIEWFNDTAATQFGLDPERDQLQQIVNLLRDPQFSAYFQSGDDSADVVMAAPGSTAARPRRLSVRLHPYGEGRRLLLSRDVTAVEQAEVMRRDFVANVSHEIRTPLTVLAGFIETLASLDLPPAEQKRYLGLMAQQSRRMQTLVDDLLTLSRLEGSPLPAAGAWTPLSTLFSQCQEEAAGLARTLGKALELHFEEGPGAGSVQLAGSPSELQSALSNLVSNAVRYTPSGGSVEVRARWLDGGKLEISVRDTGPGIGPEHLPRLTERFYRVDRSRSRETGGTGLGLAIVKHVVQRHGGELRIESLPGTGSTFAIQLPAARVRPMAVTPAGNDARPATESVAG